jgi:HAD superfamily hydrolase (TIGR01484 family)
MAYRLLAVDLDGTLLRRSDGRVDERDAAAIHELRRAGVTVTINTGRLHSGSIEAARACGIVGAIACVEGSHLVEAESERTISRHAMSAAVTQLLRESFRGLAAFVFEHDGIHHDEAGEPYAQYVRTWSPKLRLVEEALDERVWANDPLAAIAIGSAREVEAAMAVLRSQSHEVFSVAFPIWQYPGKHCILVRAAGPNKGTALVALCNSIGCTPAEAVVVGDWYNDVPMFEVAARSFVMGGAPPEVAGKATDTLTQEHGGGGGIAEAIRRAWG